ncbi:MAG: 16S rRNA processing protein RimM [Deltaproteobacteria bacterium]|nr:16S rRNA processing protein RimM [Deltaproteobacteria bacterium]
MSSQNRGSSETLLLVGKVIKPHGVKGLLNVWSYSREIGSFLHSETVFFKKEHQEPVEYTVLDVSPHKNRFLMRVKGVESFEDADDLRGSGILIEKKHLVKNSDDEFYWFELINMKVYLDSGRYLGAIKEIIPTGSNDVFVVREDDSEFLIPAIHDVIEKIDLNKGEMIIRALNGLLELNNEV